MTPNEQWAELYRPITQQRKTAIRQMRAGISQARSHGDRMLMEATLGVYALIYRRKKDVFLMDRRQITRARKSGVNPVLWKLMK